MVRVGVSVRVRDRAIDKDRVTIEIRRLEFGEMKRS